MQPKTFGEMKFLIYSDLYRYSGKGGLKSFLKNYYFNPGFCYSFWLRLCAYLRHSMPITKLFFYPARFLLLHYMYKYGISISDLVQIGSGFYIGHFGGIVIHADAVIGRDCNISQGVTIGITNRGERKGVPKIGDRVYIGPGAKIIGGISIGNGAAIGANCVVTKDVPENAVVVGIPGHVISYNSSKGYINNIDYGF
jgi:serine O-acetyltransferase